MTISPGTDSIEYVELGKVVGAWGIKGWVKVHSHTGRRQDILTHRVWFLGEERQRHVLMDGRRQGQKIVALLDGVASREGACGCIGKTVCIPSSDLPALAQGEYYWTQLQGLKAIDASGVRLGVVDHLLETGANDVLVIRQGDAEILAPYVPGVVRKVDLDKGYIELDWEREV